MSCIPAHVTVLVVGGGPAGSFASALLAQEGVGVVCCEASSFPRYHIGESLLASVKAFLKMIDACEKVEKHGFHPKPGSAFKFRPDRPEAYTDFVAINPKNGAWNVDRAEFDEILLKHAAEKGCKVFTETRVSNVNFERRPYSANWTSRSDFGTITFDYIIDCSGRQGLLSTKVFHNRQFNHALKNVATWSYWNGPTGIYGEGTTREGAIWIEGLVNGPAGWAWYIPLAGKVSIGIVMHESDNTALRRDTDSVKDHYLKCLQYAPGLMALLKDATLTDSIRTASDFSYSATSYAGDGWRMAGDAGSFIDPFFSSGVHLAFNGALSATVSVLASIRGHVPESAASAYHDRKAALSFTRFLLVVLGAYKQLGSQDLDILCDHSTATFDIAFEIIRPIIQGTSDVEASQSQTMDEESLGRAIEFIANVLITPSEDIAAVSKRGKTKYPNCPVFDLGGKMVGPEEISKFVREADEDERTEQALKSINARKVLNLYDPTTNFETEKVLGMVAHLRRGAVGLLSQN